MTARAAIELLVSLGDSSSTDFKWMAGVTTDARFYYRAQSFDNNTYITRQAGGQIYDLNNGVMVFPWMLEPGYTIWTVDLLPSSVQLARPTMEARAQMIDEVAFTAPGTVSWRPAMMTDQLNLKLSRLSEGYFIDWLDDRRYMPVLPPPPVIPGPAPLPAPATWFGPIVPIGLDGNPIYPDLPPGAVPGTPNDPADLVLPPGAIWAP